ncbi:hypothetical protein OAE13_07055 [Flavobacteriaceae bacterium]|nr:hypothetical protein [Flavobacteriaceae bacterium]
MVDTKILDIIVEAENNETSLLSFYTGLLKKNPDIINEVLKVLTALELEIEEEKHIKKIELENINLEFGTDHDVQSELNSIEFSVDLRKYNTKEGHFGYYFPFTKDRVNQHNKTLQFTIANNQKQPQEPQVVKFMDFGWFQVGLSFAKGEMATHLINHNRNIRAISRNEFDGDPDKYRSYINDTHYNVNGSPKNIFESRTKMLKIIKYCEDNNFEIIETFKKNIPPE